MKNNKHFLKNNDTKNEKHNENWWKIDQNSEQ